MDDTRREQQRQRRRRDRPARDRVQGAAEEAARVADPQEGEGREEAQVEVEEEGREDRRADESRYGQPTIVIGGPRSFSTSMERWQVTLPLETAMHTHKHTHRAGDAPMVRDIDAL